MCNGRADYPGGDEVKEEVVMEGRGMGNEEVGMEGRQMREKVGE